MAKPDGGHAFPTTDDCEHGMSLRDYFAAKAMHAELVTAGALPEPRDCLVAEAEKAGRPVERQIAYNAYRLADAMLSERAK